MTNKEFDLILKMYEMQKALDKKILDEFGMTYDDISDEQYNLAALDEVGEFIHAMKGDWCWWKKSQKAVDRKEVLEELADVYHFVLSYIASKNINLKHERNLVSKVCGEALEQMEIYENTTEFLQIVGFSSTARLGKIIGITKHYSFTIQEIYDAYLKKNKVNYQRIENGY